MVGQGQRRSPLGTRRVPHSHTATGRFALLAGSNGRRQRMAVPCFPIRASLSHFFLMKTSGTALLTARNGSSGRALRVTVLFYRRPDVWRPSVNHTTRVGVLTVGRQQYDDQVLLDDDIFYGACQHRAGRLCELYQQIISFSPINLDARTDAFFYGAVRPTTPALLAASE
jgi:hypothetical protein